MEHLVLAKALKVGFWNKSPTGIILPAAMPLEIYGQKTLSGKLFWIIPEPRDGTLEKAVALFLEFILELASGRGGGGSPKGAAPHP